MCIRDSVRAEFDVAFRRFAQSLDMLLPDPIALPYNGDLRSVSYTHLRAHETVLDLVCSLLLEKKKKPNYTTYITLTEV